MAGTEITPLLWCSTSEAQIGIVLLINREHGYWKAYIGTARGLDAREDAVYIGMEGSPFPEAPARALAGALVDGLEHRP